jgi:hypothetical protein
MSVFVGLHALIDPYVIAFILELALAFELIVAVVVVVAVVSLSGWRRAEQNIHTFRPFA